MLNILPVIIVVLGGLAVLAAYAFRHPRGVYIRSAAGVLLVTFGWALFWLLMSPSSEAGFGFFAIWVVLAALALVVALAACLGATARYVVDGLRTRRA